VDAGIRQIVDMQELASRLAGAPDLDFSRASRLRRAHLGDQRRDDVAVQQVEIIARAVQVRRHGADEIAAVLAAIRLA
jgi:hypothetical protein